MTERYYGQGSFSAALYDLIDGALCPETEAAFYRTLAIGTGTPILDLGAGTGRLTFALAEAGHDVVGVDLSHDMLAIARRKLDAADEAVKGRVTLIQSDVCELELGRSFDLAIAPYRVFNFILKDNDRSRFLQALHRHLSDTGRAAIDTWGASDDNSRLRPAIQNRRVIVELEGSPFNVARTFKSDRIDHERKIADFTVSYEILDKENRVLKSKDESLEMRWCPPDEMHALLTSHGFRVLTELGSFDAIPATTSGDRLWIVERMGHR
ncbi:class I SAM-dependent methyltransferase [Azospirillum sp. TSH100]|uniref:class I SAM-dependent methyltransferase n=1 Tax=Azospirillum sp. TSH100 TaxID=652764 RepID=UPI001304FFE5|nr:class I SAM-dependent methyltransferase [Azospirillum sp. TSH100]